MTDRTDLLPYSLDEKLLTELAQGLDDPVAVITRYDYTEDEARALSTNPYVVRQVTALRAELEKSGDMDSLRDIQHGRMLTEHMMVRALRGAMRDEAILKLLEIIDRRRERREKAAAEAAGASAGGFQVVITLPGSNSSLTVGVSGEGQSTSFELPMYIRRAEPDIIDVTPED